MLDAFFWDEMVPGARICSPFFAVTCAFSTLRFESPSALQDLQLSPMFLKSRPTSRLTRKRRPESPSTSTVSDLLVFEDPDLPQPSNIVVDPIKVKQYLQKLLVPEDQNVASCIKLVMCDSETDYFTAEVQDELRQDFGISSVSISDKTPLNVDRIVTVYGNLKQTLGVAVYLAFLLNSKINNFAKVEPFTLKSQNYHLDVLVECTPLEMDRLATRFPSLAIDYSIYNLNRNLHTATLSGDFLSLFNSLVYLFLRYAYEEYSVDANIELLNIIGVHEGDNLATTDKEKQTKAQNQDRVLDFIYSHSYLLSK